LDINSQSPQWISPMRAQCHDGVTIANGLLYWWPSVCDCQNTLYGFTCLGPAGDFNFSKAATEHDRMEQGDQKAVASLETSANDWPTFRANNHCDVTTGAVISEANQRLWWFTPGTEFIPTAPVAAGGLVFFSGSNGTVWALDAASGDVEWKAYTGGPVRFPPAVWEGRLLVGSGDGWFYAFEALTGQLLWRFNAAPEYRKIPVYGALMSTWPVASGVVVEDGIAYFAAGIVNYDGIHVYALDAATGKIKWQNNTSGHLDPEARSGVSVQGHMLIHDGKLYLAGGTSVSPAIFDMANGKCLNDPAPLKLIGSSSPRGQELYKIGDKVVACGMPLYGHPEYPVYDPTVTNKMLHSSAGGVDIVMLNNRKIMCFDRIEKQLLNNAVHDPADGAFFMSQGWGRLEMDDPPIWEYDEGEIMAVARCKNAIVLTRKPADRTAGGQASLAALDLRNGKNLWNRNLALPSSPVSWGLAVDQGGRILVTLKDGQVVCYGAKD
jgi:outer membrane protein assembly factor BamB